MKRLALRAHLEGPYAHGDRVFVWIDDNAKYKAVGRWARARVISQNGAATVTVETDKAVLRVNQSKVRRDYDPWHDVPLPRNLDKPERDPPLEPEDEEEQLEEAVPKRDEVADYVADFHVFVTKVRKVPSQHLMCHVRTQARSWSCQCLHVL